MKSTLEMTFDLLKDDICRDCRFACLKPEGDLESYFDRRYGCTRMKRRTDAIEEAQRLLSTPTVPADAVAEARNYLQKVVDMDSTCAKYGYFECEEMTASEPWCYLKKYDDDLLTALQDVEQKCVDEITKGIRNKELDGAFFGFPMEIVKKIRDTNVFESSDPSFIVGISQDLHFFCKDTMNAIEAGNEDSNITEAVYRLAKWVCDVLEPRLAKIATEDSNEKVEEAK